MSKILAFLTHPWFVRVLGMLALSAIIWFAGPLFAFADWRPLEPVWARLGLILLLLLGYASVKLWKWSRARRTNVKMMDGLVAPAAPSTAAPAEPSAQQAEAKELRRRFEEAMGVLRQARLGPGGAGGTRGGLNAFMGRFSQRHIYELPWYIIIGAPGSGKTTALLNSGLQFPLAGKLGNQALRGVGGTRNCDWWFTDQAVLLDTAGRYTTQESDHTVDAAAWGGFLDLLKKHRTRRPINGAIVTVSISELLQQTPAQREAHVEALRARVRELHEKLGIRFPIYVLVTKCDMLAGFMEFFADFGKEERAQVLGFTFPLEGAQTTPEGFGHEFAALERSLYARLTDRLQQERDLHKRSLIYGFPQQFAAANEALAGFLGQVFTPSAFTEKLQLRGVYFTSGTQEGSPIDRVMGSLARGLGLERQLLPAQRASGRSYFLARPLQEVVFLEQGLAGISLKWERWRNVIQWGGLATAVLLTAGLAAAWFASYAGNSGYLDEVGARLPKARDSVTALAVTPGNADVAGLLPALNDVRELTVPQEQRTLGFGLSQRNKLADAESQTYARLLQDALLPRLTYFVEDRLRRTPSDNPEALYEWLKAYLMLHSPERLDASKFSALMRVEWEASLPREVDKPHRDQLQRHLDALLARHLKTTVPQDADLVAQVRRALPQGLAERIFSRLKREGTGDEIPEFTIAKAGGPSAPLVFQRASGKPLTQGIPGLFTRDGYRQAFLKSYIEVAKQLALEDGWVLGRPGRTLDPTELLKLETDVRRLYLLEYAAMWERFLADIKLVAITDLRQGVQVAGILSAPDSPLPRLLRAVAVETTLGQTVQGEGTAIDKAEQKVTEAGDRLRRIMGGKAEVAGVPAGKRMESIVDDRFADIRRQVESAGEGKPAPIDGTVGILKELYTQLTAAQLAVDGGQAPPQSDVPTKLRAEAARTPEPVRSVMLTLSSTSAGQALSSVRTHLSGEINANIGTFCQQAITGRYPFTRDSSRDVTQEDFARLFAPGGLMDQFFQTKLAPYVDVSTRPWSFRKMGEASMGVGSGALMQFQRAQVLRDVFFRGGNQPSLRLEFKPVEMDASITQFILDVDGQLVKYSHGPTLPVTVQWPSQRGSNQVRLQAQPVLASGASGQLFEGPWALFRMFDRVRMESAGQPERFLVTFDIDGRKARFEVRASSVQNPFRLPELQQFQCPGAL